MKQNILKHFSFALLASGLILGISSCNKTELTPVSTSEEVQSAEAEMMSSKTTLLPTSYNPVYGVSQANTLYSVDPATGVQTSLGFMTFGGGGEYPINVTGIALSTNTASPNSYVVTSIGNNPCLSGSGTTFFLGTLPSTSLVRLGTLLGRSIKDIEYNPVDGFLYGVEGNNIVKILSMGVGCSTGVSPVSPVVQTLPGALPIATLGAGPYSIAFNWAGQCNIVAAKKHNRAIIDLNAVPTMTIASGTLFQGLTTDMVSPQEIGFCISKLALLVATNDKPTPTTTDLSYYQFNTSGSAGPIGSWIEKSNNCLADYTSKPQNTTVIIR